MVFELVLGEGTGQRKTSEFLFFLVLQDSFFIFTACVVFIIFIALTVAVTIFCLFCAPRHAIHGVFLQPCCNVFLRIWKSLEHLTVSRFSIAGWCVGPNCSLCWAVIIMGHLLRKAFAVWYFTSCAEYPPPCIKTFQLPISRVLSLAPSMKITSVNDVIIALLKALCLVTVAILPWCINPWIRKKQACLATVCFAQEAK